MIPAGPGCAPLLRRAQVRQHQTARDSGLLDTFTNRLITELTADIEQRIATQRGCQVLRWR
jgi:hypothetical protein